MSDALEEHDGKISIGGRNIISLQFADDIDALAEEEQELEALVESLDKTSIRYKMKISAEKTNSACDYQGMLSNGASSLGAIRSMSLMKHSVHNTLLFNLGNYFFYSENNLF